MNDSFNISGNIVDVLHREIIPGTITVAGGKIAGIRRDRKTYRTFIVPGLVDAHVHVESSMLPPSEFARVAAVHGTVATVSDPHEIANVLGVDGVNYMIEDGTRVPFKFYFSAPSCVPASPFETSGAVLDGAAVGELLDRREIRFLGEMMNYPGVLHGDPVVMDKIDRAKKKGKAVDGHAPGLRGADLETYVRTGITTNHESLSFEEAREDLDRGMYLQIRHGSAATLFEECLPLLGTRSRACMLCSDDKHPHDLVRGHINEMVARACRAGIDIMDVLTAASVNPVRHYGLDVGLLQPGDDAD
nr:amidohydrolase family protein [Syntrophales bacterium]